MTTIDTEPAPTAPAGTPMDELAAALYTVATIGRLAAAGLLEQPAAPDDVIGTLGQRLLRETGWMGAGAVAPGPKALASVPPGAPPSSAAGFVRELLASVQRYADGAPPGWAESDPETIRWRGRASGPLIVGGILPSCFAALPGFPERLERTGATFLDVGTGAAGLAIELCRRYPRLTGVGLEISAPALRVAAAEVAAAGLDHRIRIVDRSVTLVDEVEVYDLVWLPQPFIAPDALGAALPRLLAACRPGGALVMPLALNPHQGAVGIATDLRHVMTGGGSIDVPTATRLVENAGFVDAVRIDTPVTAVLAARRPNRSRAIGPTGGAPATPFDGIVWGSSQLRPRRPAAGGRWTGGLAAGAAW